jgi:hypothetical protein
MPSSDSVCLLRIPDRIRRRKYRAGSAGPGRWELDWCWGARTPPISPTTLTVARRAPVCTAHPSHQWFDHRKEIPTGRWRTGMVLDQRIQVSRKWTGAGAREGSKAR